MLSDPRIARPNVQVTPFDGLPIRKGFPSLKNAAVILAYAERDGWICHLCGAPVDRRINPAPANVYDLGGAPDRTPMNPSPDHLIPRSAAGTDAPANIRIAHGGCNKGRRDRPITGFRRPASVQRILDLDARTVAP